MQPITQILRKGSQRLSYFVRSGYMNTRERVHPAFPTENYYYHLKVYRFAEQFAAGKDVLDVGCGTGYGTALLGKTAHSATGIDISKQALRWARKQYPQVQFLEMNVERMEFSDASFDFVFSSENFEHLHDHAQHLAEVRRVLRPGGLFFLGTPNPEMYVGVHNRYHTHEFTFSELDAVLRRVFATVLILESTGQPENPEGRAAREARFAAGHCGRLCAQPGQTPFDITHLENTRSFFALCRP
jgi:SAM-dependent methyltransferase